MNCSLPRNDLSSRNSSSSSTPRSRGSSKTYDPVLSLHLFRATLLRVALPPDVPAPRVRVHSSKRRCRDADRSQNAKKPKGDQRPATSHGKPTTTTTTTHNTDLDFGPRHEARDRERRVPVLPVFGFGPACRYRSTFPIPNDSGLPNARCVVQVIQAKPSSHGRAAVVSHIFVPAIAALPPGVRFYKPVM
jgi:hypothetical protein